MKWKTPMFLIIFLCLNFYSFGSNRILYVDQFYHILGNENKEDNLLRFTKENGFDKIILYDLHKINRDYPLADASKNEILARFIFKAKINFGIKEVGGSGESGEFFVKAIHAYNKTRVNPKEKFDAYNLEYEFWKEDASKDGGYYCNNYMKKNGKSCNRTNSFNFFLKSLKTMKSLADNSTHTIKVEAYVGKYSRREIQKISKYVDRLLIHVYVRNPKSGYSYANQRLEYLSEVENMPKVSIIYSSETLFMGGWLKFNSLKKGEKIFIDSMHKRNKDLLKKINFTNFTYYNYNKLSKSVKYYKHLTKLAYNNDKESSDNTLLAAK
ncbi:hypothetical protein [Polaribacter porphyrae]|uniref:Uncharacterized protein n=1 Tax=Polaribacter porphyrae TaxID=1137780 RepID=A0A2S7WMZ1_9FLAO|nr:hypothetical protein [Polaribacter porphyrae]PQJ78816.1 hypothetical protein BTO18_06285 [Polaribacter porphyrae]